MWLSDLCLQAIGLYKNVTKIIEYLIDLSSKTQIFFIQEIKIHYSFWSLPSFSIHPYSNNYTPLTSHLANFHKNKWQKNWVLKNVILSTFHTIHECTNLFYRFESTFKIENGFTTKVSNFLVQKQLSTRNATTVNSTNQYCMLSSTETSSQNPYIYMNISIRLSWYSKFEPLKVNQFYASMISRI